MSQEPHELTQNQEDEINLLDLWNILWHRKIMIILICSVAVAMTMYISLRSPKFYKSETMFISAGSEAGGLASALSALPFAGALGVGAGIQSPADKLVIILKSRTISEDIIHKFDLMKVFYDKQWDSEKGAWINPDKHPYLEDAVKYLTNSVANFNKSKEGAITISVEWKDPKLAAEIANYYVYALTEFLKDKSMNITVQVVDRAVPAERKSRPKTSLNMMLAGITSLFISIFIAFFLEFLAKHKKRTT